MFRTVKEKLEEIQVADGDQFVECLQEIFSCIDQGEVNGACQAWMKRTICPVNSLRTDSSFALPLVELNQSSLAKAFLKPGCSLTDFTQNPM
jgi:hypothetical protein